jgi:hypothetical protein
MNFLKTLGGGEAAADDAPGAGGGWLASLKEKSKELAEVYKRDLGVETWHGRGASAAARVSPWPQLPCLRCLSCTAQRTRGLAAQRRSPLAPSTRALVALTNARFPSLAACTRRARPSPAPAALPQPSSPRS